jgi:hypothetical protein
VFFKGMNAEMLLYLPRARTPMKFQVSDHGDKSKLKSKRSTGRSYKVTS